jgi:hypothetical protein
LGWLCGDATWVSVKVVFNKGQTGPLRQSRPVILAQITICESMSPACSARCNMPVHFLLIPSYTLRVILGSAKPIFYQRREWDKHAATTCLLPAGLENSKMLSIKLFHNASVLCQRIRQALLPRCKNAFIAVRMKMRALGKTFP